MRPRHEKTVRFKMNKRLETQNQLAAAQNPLVAQQNQLIVQNQMAVSQALQLGGVPMNGTNSQGLLMPQATIPTQISQPAAQLSAAPVTPLTNGVIGATGEQLAPGAVAPHPVLAPVLTSGPAPTANQMSTMLNNPSFQILVHQAIRNVSFTK
uniref:Uncharacterized protein n=1 Tax=Caenorhabditis japonica TaxID=281687 RepID=A0A8R1IZM3_CAEJA